MQNRKISEKTVIECHNPQAPPVFSGVLDREHFLPRKKRKFLLAAGEDLSHLKKEWTLDVHNAGYILPLSLPSLPSSSSIPEPKEAFPFLEGMHERLIFSAPFLPLFQPQCRTRLKKSRHAAGAREKTDLPGGRHAERHAGKIAFLAHSPATWTEQSLQMALQVLHELLVSGSGPPFPDCVLTTGKTNICGFHFSDCAAHVRILQTCLRRPPAPRG